MSAQDIQDIVERLKGPPLGRHYTLVDFDNLAPPELLNLLCELLTAIDPQMAGDPRENPEQMSGKITGFLSLHYSQMRPEFKDDHEAVAAFTSQIMEGEKVACWPLLHFCLEKREFLTKRAYLARYLKPVPIPPEYMQDPTLDELCTHYRQLQDQFKITHKEFDKMDKTKKGDDIKKEITTLEDERQQLIAKIERLKKSTAEKPGFEKLLEATSQLRKMQDDDSRLAEQRRKQHMELQHAQSRHQDAKRRLQSLRQSQASNATAEALLQQLEGEVMDLNQRVTNVLPRDLEDQQMKLEKLSQEMSEPSRSQEDVDALGNEVANLENRCTQLRRQIDDDLNSRGDQNMIMSRKAMGISADKLAKKEEELEDLKMERDRLQREFDEKEQKMSEQAGPKFMTRENFKNFSVRIREKTQTYKKMKSELAEQRGESVVLHRTEQILKGRCTNLEAYLARLQEDAGVAGYKAVESNINVMAEEGAAMDESKERTLEEISSLVKDVTNQLKEKRITLAPEIKRLRESRKEYMDVEQEYNRKKQMYDKEAVGLEMQRQELERDCDHFQNECLQEENSYHYLNCLLQLEESRRKRVEDEEKWERGEGFMTTQFKTFSDMFNDRIQRQKALLEQLRKQKANISNNESGNMEQRRMFKDMNRLLDCKLKSKKQVTDYISNAGFGGNEYETQGGSKVMTMQM